MARWHRSAPDSGKCYLAGDQASGFTLVELVITIAIIAILIGVALPSYKSYLIRSNRSAAQQFMATVAAREEQTLLDLRSYVAVTATANFPNSPTASPAGVNIPVSTEAAAYYNFTVTTAAGPPPSYLIIGTPIAGKRNAADHALYLNSAGQAWRDLNDNGTYQAGTDADWS